jgi:hypothetical protein
MVIFFILLISVVIIVLVVSFILNSNDFKSKVKALGGRIKLNGWAVIPFQGREISAKYTPPSRNTPSRFEVALMGVFAQKMVIRKENKSDVFVKKIGLNQEVQVDDPLIDGTLYFECDVPEFVRQIFANERVKPMVLGVLDTFSSIRIDRDRCLFVNDESPTMHDISGVDITSYAQKLLEFSTVIPSQSLALHPEFERFKFWRMILYVVGYGTLASGMVVWIWAMALYRVVDFVLLWKVSVGVMAIVTAALGYLVFDQIKGFSASSRVFGQFLMTFAVGVLFLSRYGTAVINGKYDHSLEKAFEVKLLNKYSTKNKSSYSYYLVVAPWHRGKAPWKIKVDSDQFDQAVCGKDSYQINTKDGCLGWEWVTLENCIGQ